MQTNLVYFNFKRNDINCNTIHDRKRTFKNIKFRGHGDEFIKTDPIKNCTNKLTNEVKQLPLEELRSVDFNKIEGKLDANGLKVIKDANGKTIRILKAGENNKQIAYAIDCDPDTGNMKQGIHFYSDNTILSTFYDKKNILIKTILTRPDETKVEKVFDYDEKTWNILQESRVMNGIKTPAIKYEYDSETENLIKEYHFRGDGKKLNYISEFEPKTEALIKESFFYANGKNLCYINEYDPNTENKIKEHRFYYNGKTSVINEYDPETQYLIKESNFDTDGKLEYINEYEPQTGNLIKECYFQNDGKTISYVKEYDSKTGEIIREFSENF